MKKVERILITSIKNQDRISNLSNTLTDLPIDVGDLWGPNLVQSSHHSLFVVEVAAQRHVGALGARSKCLVAHVQG
jgi:hypothetical protein